MRDGISINGGVVPHPVGPGRKWAFETIRLAFEVEAMRLELMESIVFSKTPLSDEHTIAIDDAKAILKSYEAFKILFYVWKESEFIRSSELPPGHRKDFADGKITQMGTAQNIAGSPKDVSKLNTLVRNVCLAAYTYRLMNRNRINATSVDISATTLLDEFMLMYARRYDALVTADMRSGS